MTDTPAPDKLPAIIRLLVSLLNGVELGRPDIKDSLKALARATDAGEWGVAEQHALALRNALFGEFPDLGYLPTQPEVEGLLGLVRQLLKGVAGGGGPEGHDQRTRQLQDTLQLGLDAGGFAAIQRGIEQLLDGQADFRRSLIAEKNELRSIVVMMAERLASFGGAGERYDRSLTEFLEEVRGATALDDLRQAKDRIVDKTEDIRRETRSMGERVTLLHNELAASRERIKVLEKDLEEKVKESIHDRLTGVYNRRAFDQRLLEMAHKHRRYGIPFCLVLFDIDRFKGFNDNFGHQAGDLALIKVARKAQENLRDLDFLARYGGEEFAIVLEGLELPSARSVAEKVRRTLADREYAFRNETVRITVSLGVAQWRGGEDRIEALIARADAGLYAAKEAGRNRTVSEDELSEEALREAAAAKGPSPAGGAGEDVLETKF